MTDYNDAYGYDSDDTMENEDWDKYHDMDMDEQSVITYNS